MFTRLKKLVLLTIVLLLTTTLPGVVTMDTVTFHVQENSRPGLYVGTLRRAGAISFAVTGNKIREFNVHEKLGDISVAVSPDREIRDKYEMTVIVQYDTSNLDQTSSPQAVDVNIVITDVNDNAPVFPRKNIEMTIKESQHVGFKIPIDPAEDADLGKNSTQTYKIVNDDVPFQLKQTILGFDNQYSCNLELIKPLDREKQDSYVIEIIATDGGFPSPKSDKMKLRIKVADVNDNSPQFNQSIYLPKISESAPVGSVVCTVLATDLDKDDNAKITYYLEPRFNKGELFTIDPESGTIKLAAPLDRERAVKHDLVVRANDGGEYPERTTVRVSVEVLDVNDNTPQISVTFLSQDDAYGLISENSQLEEFVAHVTVKDQDTGENGEADISLHGTADIPFEIVKVGTGYAVQVFGALDREQQDIYHTWLTARDRGMPPRVAYHNITIRVIDTNDCSPQFSQLLYTCNVSEIADEGTDIVRVSATDNDIGVNADITYFIVGITTNGGHEIDSSPISFSINSKTGVISTGSQLDREARESVVLTIEARDGGKPRLSSRCKVKVQILDYNDNDPRFAQRHYTALLLEDAPLDTVVLRVRATDLDGGGTGSLYYSIKEYYSASRPVFAIDSTTGEIRTVSTLDYENQKSYNMVVEAHDSGGRRGVTSVEILIGDLNDNSPHFSQDTYKAALLHTVLPGTVVTRVSAFDADTGANGRVTYEILQGSDKFRIDENTGVITTLVLMSRLTNVTERITVKARDQGLPIQSTVCAVMVLIGNLSTIDLKPVFTGKDYRVEVSESLKHGYTINTLTAVSQDPDYTGEIKYTISQLTRHVHDTFQIEEMSGRIKLKKQLDREEQDRYNLVIEATDDLGRQGLASVFVTITDVNDNNPKFTSNSYHFSVSENLKPGSTVARLSATDLDYGINGIVQYSIVFSSSYELPFSLNLHTGEITVKEPLDYESETQYILKVKVYNKVNTDLCQETDVTISIFDENDNTPMFLTEKFEFTVLDSSLSGVTVGVAMATDKDSGNNGAIYYTLQPTRNSEMFSIGLNSGEIKTAKVFANSELKKEYELKVLCRDRGEPSLHAIASVTVTVQSTGQVVDILQRVLQNDALSRKAKYLIIFFAVAFLFSTFVLVCFIRYHRRDKCKYRRLANNTRRYNPAASTTTSIKSSDNNLISLKSDQGFCAKTSTDTLNTLNKNNLYSDPFTNHALNSPAPSSASCTTSKYTDSISREPKYNDIMSRDHHKFNLYVPGPRIVECGSYCPARELKNGATLPKTELISPTYFNDNTKIPNKMSKDSLEGYPGCMHRTPSRSDVASSYEMSPVAQTRRQCHSNESGVHSLPQTAGLSDGSSGAERGSTPPCSDTCLEKNNADKIENLRSDEKVRSWMSSATSEDSLFKNPVSATQNFKLAGTSQRVASSGSDNKRQVRFQKLHDSFV